MASDRNRQTVSFEELAYSNMLQVQALVELLEEKGLLTRREVLERIKQPGRRCGEAQSAVRSNSASSMGWGIRIILRSPMVQPIPISPA